MTSTLPILIAGPTASGKSGIALELAKRLHGTIINADALQVYGLWRVLTARPSAQDEAEAPHELYGHIDPVESYSVGQWLRDIGPKLKEAEKSERTPIIVGGTGLYFSALSEGLAEIPPIPVEIREEGDRLRQKGIEAFASLAQNDPAIWQRIDRNNPARLQRAWEVFEATGRPLSDWQSDRTDALLPLKNALPICLKSDPEWLGNRIDGRFDQMLQDGALEECQNWIDQGLSLQLPAAKALGAAEVISYLKGETSLEDARTKATVLTRQFAKRQRTWMRSRMKDWKLLEIAQIGPKIAAETIIEEFEKTRRSDGRAALRAR